MHRFNHIWIENRLRYRKGAKGTGMRLDEATGYLEALKRKSFTADKKTAFIKRLRVCNNLRAISKSLDVDVQSVYDAIALDKAFRLDFIRADSVEGRSKRLNDELEILAESHKVKVITDLTAKLDKYIK